MRVEIITTPSYTDAIIGWANSRNRETFVGFDVATIDAPVNELPSVLLEFKDFMILEREIFFSARNHVAWARTSRVDNPQTFTVPDEFHNPLLHGNRRELMRYEASEGAVQDQWRMHLPLVSETSWTARMSYRDLIKMHKYFSYLAPLVTRALGSRFARVARVLYEVIRKFLPDAATTNSAIEAMKLVKFLNEDDIDDVYSGTRAFTQITAVITMALRAQLVRHREITFVDDFFKMLQTENFDEWTIGNTVRMQAMARNDVWAAVVGKRACWIAQADLWQPIANKFTVGVLPCADDVCPYEPDVLARLNKEDPGVPCPRFCNLYEWDKTPFKARMRDEAAKRGVRKEEFWKQEIEL